MVTSVYCKKNGPGDPVLPFDVVARAGPMNRVADGQSCYYYYAAFSALCTVVREKRRIEGEVAFSSDIYFAECTQN